MQQLRRVLAPERQALTRAGSAEAYFRFALANPRAHGDELAEAVDVEASRQKPEPLVPTADDRPGAARIGAGISIEC
jgi:hypothetical protein